MLDSRIIVGDCLEVLAGMPSGSVQCVVTSPPYWGLRDYGTATWEGGDPQCQHVFKREDKRLMRGGRGYTIGKSCTSWTHRDGTPPRLCHCGARRIDSQLGLEATPQEYLAKVVTVFREVKRILRDDGCLFCNMGDGYLDKQLVGMPWRLALALQADGWYLRSDIIWSKPNPMPESCTDRPTKSHEYVFLLTKSPRYFWDAEAVREDGPTYTRKAGGYAGRQAGRDGALYDEKCTFATKDITTTGRNIRTVWEIEAGPEPLLGWLAENHPAVLMEMLGEANAGRLTDTWKIATQAYPDAHFATFPEKLVEPCIRAGTSERGCCPECGAAWVRVVEQHRHGKDWNANNRVGGDRLAMGQSMSDSQPDDYRSPTTTGWRPGCECRRFVDDATDPAGAMAEAMGAPTPHMPTPCTVLDPFAGSGTVGVVCARENRAFIGIELNPEYAKMAEERIGKVMRVAEDTRRQGTFEYGENPLDSPPAGGFWGSL